MEKLRIVLLVYFCVLSLYAGGICVYDKIAAKRYPRRRVRERTLLLIAAAGGAPAMLLAMLLVRHKTKHRKIMATVFVFSVLWLGVYLYVAFRFELVWQTLTGILHIGES